MYELCTLYLTENKLCLHYKGLSVNAVKGIIVAAVVAILKGISDVWKKQMYGSFLIVDAAYMLL